MIFGIIVEGWLQVILITSVVIWAVLYLSFLFNIIKEIDVGMYFRAMFKGFRHSELRIGWSSTILGIEYILGIIIAAFIKSAWYPSKCTKRFINFLLFAKKREERLELEKLKDHKKKEKSL